MIVATAGHVDHGKTALVKALTGIDADRLPEEKKRGMTIELGFAYWPIGPGETIGFVDVPGHERFIRNMLAGVTGIDYVLLIVAADDGVMPQTREHVAILDLLGARRGTVAVTKADRATPERIDEVVTEIAALIADTGLAGAPILPVSALTGAGIAALKTNLIDALHAAPERNPQGNFRLAVDRSFTLVGSGLVVTGTVFSGAVSVGDQVRVLTTGREARIRSIHAQNAASRTSRAGDRCALNLAVNEGRLDQVERGDWIVSGEAPGAAAKLDARIRVLAGEARPLAHWTPVHAHLGAADVTGRVAVLGGSAIAPGDSALVQLVLDRPVGAVRGDRLILRDQSAQRTIGGGTVVDIFPPRRGRARPERLAYLGAMAAEDHGEALDALLPGHATGIDLAAYSASRNLTAKESDTLFARHPMRIVAHGAIRLGFAAQHWQMLKSLALEQLAAAHRRSPNAIGLGEDRLFQGSGLKIGRETAAAIAAELVAEDKVVREATGLRLPAHRPRLEGVDAGLWRQVETRLDKNPLRPPSVHEIAAEMKLDAKKLEALLVRVARLGLVVRVAPNRFFRPAALRELGAMAAHVAAEAGDHRITAASFRDRAGIGRNVAIEVLEYFDRAKFTRRIGDAHEILRGVDESFGASGG